jgi:Tol biopolymer transport system component
VNDTRTTPWAGVARGAAAALVPALLAVVPVGFAGTAHAASAATTATSGPDTRLVSVAADGGAANGAADRPQISGDGRYVTFDSDATNLTTGTPTVVRRVYRRDLASGTTQVVSASSTGRAAGAWSSFSWPSDDGHLVAFVSDDLSLAATTAAARSVYVRDLSAARTELVSVSSTGRPGNGASSRPMMSPDGRFVAFSSFSSNLSPAGGNGQEQVYLRDRVAGTTRLVSVAAGGGLGNNRSYRGMVSADGRFVAFSSFATNLTAGADPAVESIFVRDLVAGTTTRVTVRPDGRPAPLGGSRPYLSPNGRYVVFNSYDPLVPSDTDTRDDVYVYDRATGAMERQSTAVGGGGPNSDSLRGFVTDDGTRSVFNSYATNLTVNDRNSAGDVFLRDRTSGTTKLLSVSWYGGGADAESYRPVTSNDGSVVAYLSRARNLVVGDPSTDWQVYAVSPATVAGTPDTTPATATVTAPRAGATVPSPVTLAGTATDDRSVADVYVQVRDNTSGLWLRPDGTWGSGAVRVPTTLADRYAATTAWSVRLSLPEGSYGFEVLAFDAARNAPASRPWTGFKVGVPDTTAPTVAVTAPTPNQSVPSPVTLAGRAADDRGVAKVFVQVRDNATSQWLRPDGTWGATATRIPAALAAPGGTTTGWSLGVPLAVGSYGFDAVAVDAAGNQSGKPWTSFRVVPG